MQRLLKVFVVEDDKVLCEAFAETLEADANISCRMAHDLPEAVLLCRQEPQVVLLVDLGLPSANGVEAVKALRKEAPGATLIVITGRESEVENAKKAGAHAVIVKASKDSHGEGLVKAVRNAVIAHDVDLMYSKVRENNCKLEQTVEEIQKILPGEGNGVTLSGLTRKP